MIFEGRNRVRYGYSRYGYTRGNGKTWHGGIDIEGLDSNIIRMPSYNGKSIRGTVTRARIVTDHSNATWEWGYYVCVQLAANQTPDAVNYLYFCHCAKLLVQVGQTVQTGDALAVMGNTGNAALAAPPFMHCHFEVRAKSGSKGLDPTAYAGFANAAGTYGERPAGVQTVVAIMDGYNIRATPDGDIIGNTRKGEELTVLDAKTAWYTLPWGCIYHDGVEAPGGKMQMVTIGPASIGDVAKLLAMANDLGVACNTREV